MFINLNFVNDNRESINELNKKVAKAIKTFDIDTTGELTLAKCLKISGEINKLIKSIKSLANAINNLPTSDKTGIILAITIETLNSEEVKSVLNESQIKQIEKFCEDTENVETIIALVDWVADEVNEVFERMDTNNDGEVSKDEIQEGCIKACKCCPGFGKSLGSCWSSFVVNILCCRPGKDSVKYKDAEVRV